MIEITYTTRCEVEECEASWSTVCAATRMSELPWPDTGEGWAVVDGADVCPEHSPDTVAERLTEENMKLREELDVLKDMNCELKRALSGE